MATRSNIAIINEDGTLDMVYCHWDGYPSHNGAILLKHYTDPDKVRQLVDGGGISVLAASLESTVFYIRDRGESAEMNGPGRFSCLTNAQSDMQEYLYVFNPKTLSWSFSDHGHPFEPLTPEACED